MGSDLDQYCLYHRCKGHNTDEFKILKRDIEDLIQKRVLKNFVARKERSGSPRRGDRNASPGRGVRRVREMKGTLTVISGGFISRGETSDAREMYVSQISGIAHAGKRPRKEGEVVISFLETQMEHVACPHENALVINAKIDE